MKLVLCVREWILKKGLLRIIPDFLYLKILYRYKMEHDLNLKLPRSYTEKLQWLKLNFRHDLLTSLVDKYEVREYVEKKIGKEYLIPLIGGPWDCYDYINYNSLPETFVLKTTHDSGGIVICKDKKNFDRLFAKKKLESSLKNNFYWRYREWPYKNVKPRIIAEKYMVDESGYELKDYKFFVFSGKVKALFIATDRTAKTDTCFDFYDRDFTHLPIVNGHPNTKKEIKKPKRFEDMIQIAEKLGEDFPHVRIDLYNIDGSIYFGEFTFFHYSGLTPFEPEEWDYKFGEWLKLEEIGL